MSDALFEKYEPGELGFHDLTFFPKEWGGQFKGISVIVDARTRTLYTMPIKKKTEASEHLLLYINKCKALGWKLAVMRSDNGGEFIGEPYKQLCFANNVICITGKQIQTMQVLTCTSSRAHNGQTVRDQMYIKNPFSCKSYTQHTNQ